MNTDVINIIGNMLPPDLQKTKEFVDTLLNTKPYSKTTNLEYLYNTKNVVCPNNSTHYIIKNGHKNGCQRYFCKTCKIYFSITNDSILKSSILNYNQLKKCLKAFMILDL